MPSPEPTPRTGRYAFWATGLALFVLWNLGTLAGGLLGTAIDPADFGLDAAAPAIFLALLAPQLTRPGTKRIAVLGALAAVALIPIVPAGVPVLGAAVVATRRATLHQLLGIVMVENGLVLGAIELPGGASLAIELGVALDLTLIALVAVVFHERIFAEFGSGDTAVLESLRD